MYLTKQPWKFDHVNADRCRAKQIIIKLNVSRAKNCVDLRHQI